MVNDKQKNIIEMLVKKFANIMNVNDEKIIDYKIKSFFVMDLDDAIDGILVSLDDFIDRKLLTKDQVIDNIDLLLELNNKKYKSVNDLMDRLKWLKEMNLLNISMSLKDNHRLVLETFDKFNLLLNGKFDCYYTGGLMGYLALNKALERYHSDLDLFINENELLRLKELVDNSLEFKFVSNISFKENNGHEYSIAYKNMSIGLFLFERRQEKIIIKNYYFKNIDDELLVDENYLSKEYSKMLFCDDLKFHNGISYKMISLESLYVSKYKGRYKDKYDACIIKGNVDENIVEMIEKEFNNNYKVEGIKVIDSIIYKMENKR